MYNIIFYEDSNGKSEVYLYFKELKRNDSKNNKQKRKKIDTYLDMLAEYGLALSEPYIKKLDNDIWELRPLRDRVLFASWCNNTFILLNIFTKKTQKTPKRELEKAHRLLKDFKERNDIL